MENKETIIEIQGIEEKTAKSGKVYHSVSTQFGKMNVFEDDIVKKLKECWKNDQPAVVNVVDTGQWKNIRSFLRVGELNEVTVNPEIAMRAEIKPSEFGKPDKFVEARESKNQSMYTSYAKDIFLEIMKKTDFTENQNTAEGLTMIMQTAIDLVKQARNEF